ncbi:MAG: PAS domain S-box protein, partial [Chloroflexia bacterium]|nr:PAS domain S-box protein [Chloroflexia bacterium]
MAQPTAADRNRDRDRDRNHDRDRDRDRDRSLLDGPPDPVVIVDGAEADAGTDPDDGSNRLLFAANPLPMWIYDLETLAFLDINAAATALYGYARDEFLAMRISDIRPAEDVERLEAHLAAVGPGLDRAGEWRHRTKDGRIIDVEIAGHPIPFAGRRSSLVVARDVTERRQSEQRLRAAETTYRALVEQIPAAVYRHGLEIGSDLTYISPRIVDILGYSPAEVVARPGLFQDEVHPDDVPASQAANAQTEATGENFDTRYRVRHADGRWVWVRDQARLVRDPAGRAIEWLGLLTDIAEETRGAAALRASEARFRSLIANASDTITVLDPAGRVASISPAIERTLGHRPDDLVGRDPFDLIHPDDHPVANAALAALVADPTSTRTARYRFRHADGSWRWQEAIGTNCLGDAAVAGIVINSRDIDERVAAEADLRAAEERFRTLVEHLPAIVSLNAVDAT